MQTAYWRIPVDFIPTLCSEGIGFELIVLVSLPMARDSFFFRIFGPEGWRVQAAPKVVNEFTSLHRKVSF